MFCNEDCATIFYVVHLLFSLFCAKIEKTFSTKKVVTVFISFHFTRTQISPIAFCDNVFPLKTSFRRKIAFISRLTVVGWRFVKSDETKRCLCLNIYVQIANSLSRRGESSNATKFSIILKLKVEIENKINLMAVQIKCHKFNNIFMIFFAIERGKMENVFFLLRSYNVSEHRMMCVH